MRGKSTSSSENGILETENKLENLSESQLSGAYIRSLVKKLSSSRTKGHETSADRSCNKGFSDHDGNKEKPHQPPKQQKKKQVRRRLHTSKPYQERLLDMAEARREIVTALKFHRAAMKKAKEEEDERQQQQKTEAEHLNLPFEPSPDQIPSLEHDEKSKSRRNPRIYASNQFPSAHLNNFSYSSGIYVPCSAYSMPLVPSPPQLIQENFNFALPSQTLGLNLNLQDFNDLDALAYNNYPSSIYSSSSSASTSSSPLSAYTEETPCVEAQGSVLHHHAMDDKEMEELRSIGEQYQMEWNDNMNLANSAWWFKFLNAMEVENGDKRGGDLVKNSPFDEVVEIPSWLNANDECCVKDDYFQDPTLSCMEIGEIEGMDAEWFA